MGSGKGQDVPVSRFVRDFGGNGGCVKVKQTLEEVSKFIAERGFKRVMCMIDTPQVIESSEFNVKTGDDKYRMVKRFLAKQASILNIKTLISCWDCKKASNKTKEMVYYTIGSKRRVGVVPLDIIFPPEQVDPDGDLFITDNGILINTKTKPDWTSFKMSRYGNQINHYFGKKIGREVKLWDQEKVTDTEYSPDLRLIVDNFIGGEDLFGIDENLTPYSSIDINYKNGQRVSIEMKSASTFSESEQVFTYWAEEFHKNDPHDAYFMFTSDQDIIPILAFGLPYNIPAFVVLPKKKSFNYRAVKNHGNGGRHLGKIMLQMKKKDPIKILKKRKDNFHVCMNIRTEQVGFVNEQNLKKLKNRQWKKQYWILDIPKMCTNIHNKLAGSKVKFPVATMMFRFLLGGCDYYDRDKNLLYRVGFETIDDTFVENIAKYSNMVTEKTIDVEFKNHMGQSTVRKCKIADVDFKTFRMFVRDVYVKKSAKTGQANFKKFDKNTLYVMPRQFMFHTLWLYNNSNIRRECGYAPVFNPFEKDHNGVSLWGYEEKEVKGCKTGKPVCVGTKIVSMINLFGH